MNSRTRAIAETQKPIPELQRKVLVGSSNDPLERQADQAADLFMSGKSAASLFGGPNSSRQGEGTSRIQRKSLTPTPQRQLSSDAQSIISQAGPGHPLPASLRAPYEQSFGHDFSQVRIHTGPQAAESASSLNARAYALGNHIVFGEGRPTSSTKDCQRLLTHELAHVVQQKSSTKDCIRCSPGDKSESSNWSRECESEIAQLVENALRSNRGDVELAFKELRDLRQTEEHYFDINLAIAADYFRARRETMRWGSGPANIAVEGYMLLKQTLEQVNQKDLMAKGPGPVSPYSDLAYKYMHKGIRDQEDSRNTGVYFQENYWANRSGLSRILYDLEQSIIRLYRVPPYDQ